VPQGPPRIRRARPVADAPVDALLAAADDLTKGWLLALLEQAPLGDAPGILAADVVHEGPRLFGAIVRALASDADLRQIQAGGELEQLVARTGELAGDGGTEAAMGAVDTLQRVVWSAIRAEVRSDDTEQLPELAERLGLVSEVVRGAVLRRGAYPGSARSGPAAAERRGGGTEIVSVPVGGAEAEGEREAPPREERRAEREAPPREERRARPPPPARGRAVGAGAGA
jgi:hypothetical protein